MKHFPETRMLRAAKSSPPRPVIHEIAIFLLVFFIGMTAQGILVTPFELAALFTSDAFSSLIEHPSPDFSAMYDTLLAAALPPWVMAISLLTTVTTIITCLVYCLRIEKRNTLSLGLIKQGAAAEYAVGMAIGFALLAGAVGIGLLTGSLELSVIPSPNVGLILFFFLGYTVQGFSEELLCRAYLMVSLSRGAPLWVCVLTNALLFAALHMFNPGITVLALLNITLFGILASLYTLRRGSIWGIAAVHTVWNFAQGNVFGISVSGMNATPSLLAATGGEGDLSHLIHGGSFGLEGGLAVTIILIAGIGVLYLADTKKSELPVD